MMSDEWLKKLKAGDKVVLRSSGMGASAYIRKVDKVTKLYVFVSSCKFRISNGREPGKPSFSRLSLEQWTPEIERMVEEEHCRYAIIKELRQVDFSTYSTESLKKIQAMVHGSS